MRPDQTLSWEGTDTYLGAYRRRQEQVQPDYGLRVVSQAELDAPVGYHDPYAQRARELLSRSTQATEAGGFTLAAEAAHKAFENRRKEAEQIVRMADKLGEPVDPEIRRRAETPSAHGRVQEILHDRGENRRAALREASKPAQGRDDGSHVQFPDDPTGLALARERALGEQNQIAQHREMAAGKPTRGRRWFGERKR